MRTFNFRLHPKKIIFFCIVIAGLIVLSSWIFYTISFRAPKTFPETAVIVVPPGSSLSQIALDLEKEHIIRSPFWFTNFVLFLKQERGVVGGEYYFEKPMSVYQIARRVSTGDYNNDQLKTTIPEGVPVSDISLILKKNYPLFDTIHFLTIAQNKEGYLFPDTYYLGYHPSPEKVLGVLTETFEKKIAQEEIQTAITSFGRPLHEVLTMASILEGEARQTRTRQIVAGILWERIKRGIPLQVDAAFRYVNGKTTKELTMSDLKIDSPYNTYVYKGLPPTPISNPGLDSILAAVTPIQTEYIYFLTDNDGNMHYAVTLDEHVKNKNKYLK
ncbi:endolytic transglycosylase MltG [Patescibacteria group bacterium]|nr:endolytic transglycosylase MltG [Patescibacteria group bacterium]